MSSLSGLGILSSSITHGVEKLSSAKQPASRRYFRASAAHSHLPGGDIKHQGT
jgi:hypothetical protein